MIFGDHAQFRDMFALLDAVKHALFAFEHAHPFAVHVDLGVIAAVALIALAVVSKLIRRSPKPRAH